MRPFATLYNHRQMLWATAWNDVRARYAGSALGFVWLVLYPLLLLGAYAAVYIYIFKVRFNLFDSNEYVALIFCGLIPFIGFSEALGTGVTCVSSNSGLIKNTLFPIELIPPKTVFFSQCTQISGTVLLLFTLAYLGRLTPYAFLVVPIWCMQILFSIGVIWILSSLNVFFRDLQSIMGVVTLILMMISPISYTKDMVPDELQPFLAGNPLYYLISCYQDVLMFGRAPDPYLFLTLDCIALGTFLFGYFFFMRMKRAFADNV